MIDAAAAKKKGALSKKADVVEPNRPSKRPHQKAKSTREAPHPHKRVKTLAKKGEREIHVISSGTTEATASNVLPTAPAAQEQSAERPAPISRPTQVSPTLETVEPAIASTTLEVIEPSIAAPDGEPPPQCPQLHLFRR